MRSRIVREGTIGLFAIVGLVLLGGLVVWLRGGGLGKDSYQIIVSFEDVSGLQLGAPVNYRGVRVGRIVGLAPGSNDVNVTLEIDSSELKIPRDVRIEANRYGLIGEASVDITPLETLSEEALAVNPLSPECGEKGLILCDQTLLEGESGSQLVASLTRLSQAYSDPVFLANLNATASNAAIAGEKIAKLSDEISLLSKTTRQEIQGVSETVAAIQGTANRASRLVENLDKTLVSSQNDLQRTINQASTLMENLNGVVSENRGNIQRTLISAEKTSNDLQKLAASLEVAINRINSGLTTVDPSEMAQNLETILAETSQTSANLRQLSDTLNDPANLANLLKTLDSARVTFENTQKITSDVEELIGDPALRENLRKMINGLSDLVSSTQQLEQKVATMQRLQADTSSSPSSLSVATSINFTPFTPNPSLPRIHPQTSQYQIISPPELEDRHFLSRKEDNQMRREESENRD